MNRLSGMLEKTRQVCSDTIYNFISILKYKIPIAIIIKTKTQFLHQKSVTILTEANTLPEYC